MKTKKKNLVQIIRSNPGCVAVIDNDFWYLLKARPSNWDDMTRQQQYEWRETAELATADGYGHGGCYGGDILQALAEIAGIKIESI